MKIAFVSFDFGEYCIRLANGLEESADVLLLLPERESGPYRYLLSSAIRLITFVMPRLRQPARQLRMTRSLVKYIRQFSPDVIHLQSGHLWFNFALPLLRRFPLVLTVHDPSRHVGDAPSRKTPQWVLDWGCRRASQVIVHAPQLKAALVSRMNISGDRVHVIPHVLCGDDELQKKITEEEDLILFFGRIWEYKGLEYLIRAEPLITAEVPTARIVIAGVGERFDQYQDMMVHPERFIVHNEYIADDKRAELFRRASVVVLPYIEASQSGVIPIAYRFGKPVVATATGGLPAMVEHGKTGYLVPPRDAGALARAIILLLRNKDLRREFGANGMRKINTECAPGVVAQQTFSVYSRAINGC